MNATSPVEVADAIPPLQFAARAVLVAIEITLVIYLGQPGALFFYQLF